MADPDSPLGTADSNNFDNDFEKVEPLVNLGGESEESPPEADMGDDMGFGMDDQQVSSTSPEQGDVDLYSASEPIQPAVLADLDEPLVSFEDPVPPSEPMEPPQPSAPAPAPLFPDTAAFSTLVEEKEPTPPRQPDPVVEVKPAKKPTTSAGSGQPWYKSVDPRVIDLIYWRDVKKTGVVFGSLLVLLLSLALFSVLSVVAYLSLAALTVTITFVVYKKVMGAVQKAGEGHPFKQYLEMDISLPEDKVHQVADIIMRNLSTTVKELRRLFLVEDVVDSLKYGLMLWVLTYIGAWFNGMTLLILGVVGVFTLPKFYETYKVQIDQNLDLAKTRVKEVMKKVQEKIPMPGKKKTA